jgi:hypothetical protein
MNQKDTMNKKELLNPNSSGQGLDLNHVNHPLFSTVISFGYEYSHTTNVGNLEGYGWNLHHTFRRGDHTVTLYETQHPSGEAPGYYWAPSDIWWTKCGAGSGHEWNGKGKPELVAHLKSKRRRYPISLRP